MKLTERSSATGLTLNQSFLHIVNTNDTSQDPAGSSYKAPLSLLTPLFGGGTFTGNTSGDCITDLYLTNLYGCSPITVHDHFVMNEKQIQANLGSAFLDLSVGSSAGEVQLKTSDTFADTYLYMVTSGYSINYVPHNYNSTDVMYVEMDHIQYGNGFDAPVISIVNTSANNLFSSNGEMWFGMNHYEESSKVGGLFIGANYYEHKSSQDLKNVATILSSKNSTIQSGASTTNDVIIGGENHIINTGVFNSVILGGQNLNATTSNTAYVPRLNINDSFNLTPSDEFLGILSNGDVINTTTIETKTGLFIEPSGSTGSFTSFYYNISDSSSWSGYTPDLLAFKNNNNKTEAPNIALMKTGGNFVGTSNYAVQQTGTIVGEINWYSTNGSVPDPKNVSRIDSVITNLSQYADLRFYTRNRYGLNERMLIDEDGKVGIGTSTPTDTLHINSTSGTSGSNQFRLEQSFTPSGSGDTSGNVGSITWGDTYIYVKTNSGWGRALLDYAF